MKKALVVLSAALLGGIGLYVRSGNAADFSGIWCVKSDPKECAIISAQGDKVKGEFRHSGSKTVDLIGYQQGSSLAMSFINSKKEVGAWMLVQKTSIEVDAVCLNPDGSERWKATYVRKKP